MSDTHKWNVSIAGDVIGDIIESGSTFYTGPFAPGEFKIVANALIKNIGSMGGILHYNLYQYPGTGQESIVVQNQYFFDAGQQITVGYNATIPNIPGQTWPLGIKVWSETENEPSWALGGASVEEPLPPYVLPAVALAGLIIFSFWIIKK
ncbi:unnamed protein product [marine sediment metagenome]|uniref:Uncharacterized protein n=1 Tax=marine sediment metagenome TaxID=412755 RepID=X1N9L6_9ZZZZ